MPSFPKSNRKNYLPNPPTRQAGSNQEFYNSKKWKGLRNLYIKQNPLCEFNHHFGRVVEGNVVDHIIPITKGGHPTDENNFMTLNSQVHDRKSALERHKGCLIDYVGKFGFRLPKNRADIFEVLKK